MRIKLTHMIGFLLGSALSFSIGQRIFTNGGWFSLDQFVKKLCHEDLILLCFVAGVCLMIGRFK